MYSIRFPALAATIVLFATPALSETINAASTGHGTSTSTAMPVSEGLVMVHAVSTYDRFDTEDPNSPFATAKGPCFGSILIDKGAVSGDGLCHYTDGDGDLVAMKWMAKGMSAEGRTLGEWMILGGTGKWDGASGGGDFDAGGDPYTNNVTGEMIMN